MFFTGGPGADALGNISELTEAGLNRDRDLVVLYQRGTYSPQRPLTCPEIDRFYGERVSLLYDAPSTGDRYVQAAARCRERLTAQGVDPAPYNTSENAADVADLRRALGIRECKVADFLRTAELGAAGGGMRSTMGRLYGAAKAHRAGHRPPAVLPCCRGSGRAG